MGVGWADPELTEISLRSNVALWRQEWAEENGVFSTVNEPLPSPIEPNLREERLDELVGEVLDERMYVSYLAQLQLMHILQHEVPSLYWPRPDAYGYWTRLISLQ
jgi:hypothetical protein